MTHWATVQSPHRDFWYCCLVCLVFGFWTYFYVLFRGGVLQVQRVEVRRQGDELDQYAWCEIHKEPVKSLFVCLFLKGIPCFQHTTSSVSTKSFKIFEWFWQPLLECLKELLKYTMNFSCILLRWGISHQDKST